MKSMLACREVIAQLWDYLDGELAPERAADLAAHLAECARCYPRYRFAFVFLAAIARQRDRIPKPSQALIQRLRLLIST